MINLKNDYCAIAHPKVLSRLIELNEQTFVGYGLDEYSKKAAEFIKDMIKCETADVHFLVGGTITNKVVISHALKSYQAVISADSGHINVHETGTIEQSGHKVLTVPNVLGKINVTDLEKVVKAHTDEHMVMPKWFIYQTQPNLVLFINIKNYLQYLITVKKIICISLWMEQD